MAAPRIGDILELWQKAAMAIVRSELPDLTTRQMAVLLSVYCSPPPHTVRGLARKLDVSKPVITRAIDTLAAHGLLRRRRDAEDRRSVLIERTVKGAVFLSDFRDLVAGAVEASGDGERAA